jgi:hypothetical protein
MTHTYRITGMTCNNCKASVEKALLSLDHVDSVTVDLKGFPDSFRMYDPLAKLIPTYGWIYPFIELTLGLLFLLRIEIDLALVVTLIVLGLTTFGVTKSLLSKKSIQCACLGTALKLPMTKATFIENSIMIIMAVVMLLKTYN